MFKDLDKGMKDFLKLKGFKELSVQNKIIFIFLYPYILSIYTYGLLRGKINKK